MSIGIESVLIKKSVKPTKIQIQKAVVEKVHAIRQVFNKRKIEQVAWDSGFIKRSNYKVGGNDFLISLIVASLDSAHASLEKISSIITQVNQSIQITAQSIMERLNSTGSVNFFQNVQKMVLRSRLIQCAKDVPPSLFSRFTKVLIHDSTVIELHERLQEHFKGSGGRSSKSCLKIDVIYDLISKKLREIHLNGPE